MPHPRPRATLPVVLKETLTFKAVADSIAVCHCIGELSAYISYTTDGKLMRSSDSEIPDEVTKFIVQSIIDRTMIGTKS